MNKAQANGAIKKVEIEGKSYPCYMTMGALILYKRMTGCEMSEVKTPTIEETMDIVFCVLKSACKANSVEFPFEDSIDLACHLTPEQMNNINLV